MSGDLKVHAPDDVMTQLVEAFEGAEIHDLEVFAAQLGVRPPDDRDGWQLTYMWGQNGEDEGLHWYQAEDEPLTMLDY